MISKGLHSKKKGRCTFPVIQKMTNENMIERGKYYKPVALSYLTMFSSLLILRFITLQLQPTKSNLMQVYVNVNAFVFTSFSTASVFFLSPSTTVPILMIDSVAKTVGHVLNAWYAPRIINKAIAEITVLELATVTMEIYKHKLKIDSVLLMGCMEAVFISPIPLLSVGMIAHFVGTYLIFMEFPRHILIAQLIESVVVEVTTLIFGYVAN